MIIYPEPIAFTSSSSVNIVENNTDVVTLRASGGGPDSGTTNNYTFYIDVAYGDGSLFEISNYDFFSGSDYADLSFINSPDFELLSPAAEDNTYSIRVSVSDDIGSYTTQEITINVTNENDAPTVSTVIIDASIDEDAAYSYDASANFTDVDAGDTLTYSATLQDGNTLPSWLSINSSTALLVCLVVRQSMVM